MKRPYLVYLLTAVIPAALAIGAMLHAASSSWREVRAASDARVAAAVLSAFQEDLARTADSLLVAAMPNADVDPGDGAVARALAGDTVSGMRPSAPGQEVFVLAPPREGDPEGVSDSEPARCPGVRRSR